ncbi:MAG TPA: ABC transporter substrate binding protein [Acidobacteriota bacterium]|nr:ABC transporter substrate binding protein [Acidobacteriota bacterium]
MITRLARFILPFFLLVRFAFADLAFVKTAGVSEFDEVRNGFSSTCFENRKEFDLTEDASNESQIIEQIRAGSFRLLVSVGPQATRLIHDHFPGVPMVFSYVPNPKEAGLKGDHVTGIPLNVPIREQFSVLRSIDKKSKRLGVIYTQSVNESLVSSARSIAEDEDFILVPSPISSSQDIQRVLPDLLSKCDALWIPPDPSLISREVIRYIGSTALSKRIPFIGANDRYVRSGAIFTLVTDPVEAGKAAGDLANQILKGATPAKLSIPELQKPKVILNLKAAGLLGLSIPKNVQNAAAKIYE